MFHKRQDGKLADEIQRVQERKRICLAIRDEAQAVFEEAMNRGNPEITEEVEEMIIDLEFSIEENKCKCHRKSPVIGLFQPFR